MCTSGGFGGQQFDGRAPSLASAGGGQVTPLPAPIDPRMTDPARGTNRWDGNKMGMMPFGRQQWGFGGVPGFGMQQPTEVMMATQGPEFLRPLGVGGAGFNPFAYGGQGGLLQALMGSRMPMAMTNAPTMSMQQMQQVDPRIQPGNAYHQSAMSPSAFRGF